MFPSLSKAKLSFFRKFGSKKFRESEGKYLIEGWHLLEAALDKGAEIESLIVDRERSYSAAEKTLISRVSSDEGEIFEARSEQLDQIADTRSNQGVLGLARRRRTGFDELLRALKGCDSVRLILLDAIGDPGNCGTILRSGDWFGVDGVVMGTGCAELENSKTVRSTMGAIFHLPIVVGVDLVSCIQDLKAIGICIYSAELNGASDLFDFNWPKKAALVVGNEARGVSSEVSSACDGRLAIPKFGQGESLNAAMAASVMLAHWRQP